MKNTKKGITLLLLFILLGSVALFSQQVQAKTKTEIEFWTMQLKPTYTDYINGLIQQYETEHPDVNIKWVDVPWVDLVRKLVASVSANNAPDIVNLHIIYHSKFAKMGALVNLDNYLTAADYNNYFAGAINATKFDGKTVGLPWYLATEVTMYNKEIFKEAGLNPDNPPQNFAELEKAARIIKEKTGKYGVLPPICESGRFLKYMIKDGITILNKEGNKAVFNSQQAVDFLKQWVQLYKEDVIPPETVTGGHREAVEMFQSGQLAILATGPQFLNQVRENAPDVYKNTGVAPEITTSNVGLDVQELVVMQQSKNKKAAIDFAKFVTNAANQLAFCKLATILPSAKEAASDSYFTDLGANPNAEDIARKISAEQLKKSAVLFHPHDNMTELNEALDKEVQSALLGVKTPQQALDDAVVAWDKLLAE